ncbi:hypothetical protein KSS87_017281 [Heliosperma pusillum]|nr:hypothetical protein KSS87_017281 [Heliosperma pusillum]
MHHLSEPRELKPVLEPGSMISSVVKLDSGKSQIQDVVGSSNNHMYRNVGPLGPFTGYATILRGSKFLKPAQVILDEFLTSAGLRHVRECDEVESVPNSIVLGSKFRGSDDMSSGSGSGESYRPDCNEKKAKLLHMQEEVCKRHKQYHQQMEMVMSAFESVPGLSKATPYISRSLKAISRHFRTLKNAISDQLKVIKRALGEDISTPTSHVKGGDCSSRFDRNCVKAKTSVIGGASYGGQQNHIWRPQRGLPERAVSVLRAWLFDHFLHPYPTDSDKQMLASQTGLSRNQVSNWFINARVRLWKPMVEEIHMLETKGTTCSTPVSNHRQAAVSHKPVCKPTVNAIDCLESSSYMEETRGGSHTEQLHLKGSRIESHQIPASMDESFLGFLPYQRRGLELGGLGAVSLTLGLRHGSETNHQQQLQHQFQQQGMHFGGHVLHDFTG